MATNNAVNIASAGLVRYDGAGNFSGLSLTNHALLIGGASNAITSLVLTAGQIPIGTTSGDPAGASITGSNGITVSNSSGAIAISGTVVQTVFSNNITGSSTSSGTYVDVTGANLSITPTSASNKILVHVSFEAQANNIAATNNEHVWNLLRGASIINTTDTLYDAAISSTGGTGAYNTVGYTIVDSPATTSSTTYKLQHRSVSSNSVSTQYINIVLQEIVA